MLRFVDMFAGLGGFHLAMNKMRGKCVFACEIDDRLRQIYMQNHGIMPAGDIRSVRNADIPAHDLFCAGFPCQPFSKAGDQRGLDDGDRGSIFFEIRRILKKLKPEYIILENVAHFVNHDAGNTYEFVRSELVNLGYDVAFQQYSPHQFGVPQIRQRFYLVGRRGGLNGFQWPEANTQPSDLSIKTILDKMPSDSRELSPQVIECLEVWQEFLNAIPSDSKLPSFPIWAMEFKATYPYREYKSLRHVDIDKLHKYRGSFGNSLNVSTRSELLARVPSYAQGIKAFPRWKQSFIEQNRLFYAEHRKVINPWLKKIRKFPPSLQKLEWNCQGEKRDIWSHVVQFRASGVRVKRATTAPSLVAMTTTQVPIITWDRRYMTVKECARLQSMQSLKHLPTANQAYKALGNAVNVTVAHRILKSLLS